MADIIFQLLNNFFKKSDESKSEMIRYYIYNQSEQKMADRLNDNAN